jgi:hypothetical protein
VRECLPAHVLGQYDRMKVADSDLLECPEIFAMAVLVSAYRHSSPDQRRKLIAYFPTPAPAAPAPRRGNVTKRRGTRLTQSRRRNGKPASSVVGRVLH